MRRLGRDPLRRLSQRPIKLELSAVVVIHGGGILLERELKRDECGDNFLRAHNQAEQLSLWPRRLAQAHEVLVGRLGRLDQPGLCLRHACPRRLHPGKCLRYL
jgi:hypothetical protein